MSAETNDTVTEIVMMCLEREERLVEEVEEVRGDDQERPTILAIVFTDGDVLTVRVAWID